MTLSSTAMQEMIAFAHTLADAAGDVLCAHFNAGVSSQNKADGSPVTLADHEAEAAMRARIATRFPEHGIFGEEGARVHPHAPLQWVLDPIDGTRAFIAGATTFTTLIALCGASVPVLGVIDQPVRRERWVGAGGQAHCNQAPVRVSGKTALREARVATTSLDYFTARERAGWERLAAAAAQVTLGGDAYAYAMLARGEVDVVVDAHMKPYDFCALAPVVAGAGGTISDWHGAPLSLHSDGTVLAAATPALAHAAMDLIAR